MTKSKTAGSTATGERRGKATLGTSGNGTAVFQCQGFGDCRMVFTRSEHLARHIRKHTGERPFQCHCQKSFSRLDNLRQHCQTVHSDTPEQNQELLRKLTTLHTNLTTSVAKNQHYAKGFRKGQLNDTNGNVQQKRISPSPPVSQEESNKRRYIPQDAPDATFNSLLSDEESPDSRYPPVVKPHRSYSPPMMSYTRPAPYSYIRRPYQYAYPSDLPSSRMALSYGSSRADYAPEIKYKADNIERSWKYGKYESPSTTLPPLQGVSSGPLPMTATSEVPGLPVHPSSTNIPESRLVSSFLPPIPLSRVRKTESVLPSISKPALSTPMSATSHQDTRVLDRDSSASLPRPSLPRLEAMASEPRPTRLVPGMTPPSVSLSKSGKYQRYSSMDDFHQAFYAAPCYGGPHRKMDISPAGLGLTSPIPSLASRTVSHSHASASQSMRSMASFDTKEDGYAQRAWRWGRPYQKAPSALDGHTSLSVPKNEANSLPTLATR